MGYGKKGMRDWGGARKKSIASDFRVVRGLSMGAGTFVDAAGVPVPMRLTGDALIFGEVITR